MYNVYVSLHFFYTQFKTDMFVIFILVLVTKTTHMSSIALSYTQSQGNIIYTTYNLLGFLTTYTPISLVVF